MLLELVPFRFFVPFLCTKKVPAIFEQEQSNGLWIYFNGCITGYLFAWSDMSRNFTDQIIWSACNIVERTWKRIYIHPCINTQLNSLMEMKGCIETIFLLKTSLRSRPFWDGIGSILVPQKLQRVSERRVTPFRYPQLWLILWASLVKIEDWYLNQRPSELAKRRSFWRQFNTSRSWSP